MMDVEFGPHVDGIRVGIDREHLYIGTLTADAGYRLGSFAGAHDPDSELSQLLLDVQQMGGELARQAGSDVLLHAPFERVLAAAMATQYAANVWGMTDEEYQETARQWQSLATSIRAVTDDNAVDSALDPTGDRPTNPWGDEADEDGE